MAMAMGVVVMVGSDMVVGGGYGAEEGMQRSSRCEDRGGGGGEGKEGGGGGLASIFIALFIQRPRYQPRRVTVPWRVSFAFDP